MNKFVVAYNRDRDFHQVPLALAEVDLLECLVTDLGNDLLARLAAPRLSRASIDFKATSSVIPAALQFIFAHLGKQQRTPFRVVDYLIGSKAFRAARKHESNLYLYSGYGAAARVKRYRPRYIDLFQFHPVASVSRKLLLDDSAKFKEARQSALLDKDVRLYDSQMRQSVSELSMATRVVCASSFTKRSIGDLANDVRVVPYGLDTHIRCRLEDERTGGPTRFLFVGQGIQRKGLHHLLRAWREAKLAADLTVIATNVDHNLLQSIPARCTILPRVESLDKIYSTSDVVVLPSLVEGFGLVIPEALAYGNHVIASTNTGLPDLDVPSTSGTIFEAGNLEALRDALVDVDLKVQGGAVIRSKVASASWNHSWASFREGIRNAVVDRR